MSKVYLSRRQINLMTSFGSNRMEIHYGPFGCGKTYAATRGLGLYCYTHKPSKLGFALVARTLKNVKRDMCKELIDEFNDSFKFIGSENSANTATLFGHKIYLVGLNDSSALSTIRGLSVRGILQDEITTSDDKRYFNELQGRLRGDIGEGENFFYVGLTNPDSPMHWLYKDYIKPYNDNQLKDVKVIRWSTDDIILPSAIEYYNELKERYKNSPCYYDRYINGEWAAADGLVYHNFNPNIHIIDDGDLNIDCVDYYKMGIDFGISNKTAILIIAHTIYNENVVVEEVSLSDEPISNISNVIKKKNMVYKPRFIYYDPSAEALYLQLRHDGVSNIFKANNSVRPGIDRVFSLFSDERLFIYRSCKELTSELSSYSYKDDSLDEVKKINDHFCDALRYGCYTPFAGGIEK